MTTDLIAHAIAGDGDAFRALTDPYHRELHLHCYRMLGSVQDAEDALQDTLLDAWRGLAQFEARSSMRTWLYRIATNKCLNSLRSSRRRPATRWEMGDVEPPQPSRLGEVTWLDPYPDDLLVGAIHTPMGPEARFEQREAISLAFVTAVQLLPPRQRAVLILHEVLGYRAREVADLLDSSLDSVNSALKRARATLRRQLPADGAIASVSPGSPAEQSLVTRFVRAYEAGDVEALLELFTDDVCVSMPPIPFEYVGVDVVGRFYAAIFGGGRGYDLVPTTRANGQLAFGAYVRTPMGVRHGAGLLVLTLHGEQIGALTRFENTAFARFGLPLSLPA